MSVFEREFSYNEIEIEKRILFFINIRLVFLIIIIRKFQQHCIYYVCNIYRLLKHACKHALSPIITKLLT